MKKLYSVLLFTFIAILSSYSQTVEDTFIQPIAYKAAKITQIKELPDGKMLLAGDIAFYGNTPVNNLIRLNADYSLDQSFLFTNPNNLKIKKVELQSNGNIIVLANVDNPWGGSGEQSTIFQFNSNGEVITSISTLIDVSSIAVQTDDKILVSLGHWSVDNGNLYRYNSDLTLDESFNNDITFDKQVADVKVFGNSIYVSGMFSTVDGIARNSIAKLNSDGTVDTTFDAGQGSNGSGFSMTIQEDGKILIGGNFYNMNENATATSVIRLNSDGSLDSSFSSPYYSAGSSQIAVKDSYIYLSSQVIDGPTSTNYFLKLKSDGTLADNFTPVKLKDLGYQFFVVGCANDKIFYNSVDNSVNKYGLAAYNIDGSAFDSSVLKPASYGSFEKGGYFNGKLIVKGDFVRINDVDTFGIGLLDETGTVDESFVFENYLGEIKQFQIIDNSTVFVSTKDQFLKLDNQGNILKNFDFKANTQLQKIEQYKVLENGKILITDQSGLFMLDENGVQESVFTINSNPDYYWVSGIKFEMQNDKIICSALLINFSSTAYIPKLIRFNLDSTLDESFNVGQGPDTFFDKVVVLNSGEIIVAGWFSTFNGISVPNQIVKLSANGVMDLQFNQNLSAYQIGYGQSHDYKKIEEIDGVLYITEGDSRVTAINLDGTLVNNFQMPVTIDQVNDLVASEEPADNSETSKKSKSESDSDTGTDKYMFAFGTVNNPSNGIKSVIVKVNLGKKSGTLGLNPITGKAISNVQIFPVPVQEKMSLSFSNSIVPTKVAVYSLNGTELYSSKVKNTDSIDVDMSNYNPGVYFIKVFSDSGVTTKKIIKK